MNFRSKKCDFNVDTIQKVVYTIDSVERTLKEWRCVRLNRTLMKDLVSWKSKRINMLRMLIWIIMFICKNFLSLYENDFCKHIESKTERERTRMVWNSIPMRLAKENKKFFFGQIKKGARSAEFKGALAEQYVHQQIVSTTAYTLYYYSNVKSHNEIRVY